MERKTQFIQGEFYHVYNRGIDKRKIFFTENDKKHFQNLLLLKNDSGQRRMRWDREDSSQLMGKGSPCPLVAIIAYVLLDNHFHLVLKELEEGGISKFMSKLLTAHAMYMNKKYERTGPLMCRPFRAKHIDSDGYFRWLIAYVHLNTLDMLFENWKEEGIRNIKKAQTFLETYKYSSFLDYFGKARPENNILARSSLPINIKDLDDVRKMVNVQENRQR